MNKNGQAGFMTGVSLLVPITLSVMAIVLLSPVLPQLLREFDDVPHHEYWVPMILTVPALCVAVFSPIAGIAGDYFGRRPLLLGALTIYGILGVAPVFLSSLPAILLSRVGVGITEAMIMVLTTTMIGDYFAGAARDKWLAAQTAVASLSAMLFFNIGGQLGAFGWRAPFWVYLSSLIMLVMVLLFTRKAGGAHDTGDEQSVGSAAWSAFPWRKIPGVLGVTIYGSVFFYTVQIQASVGLASLGLTSPAEIGFMTSIASIGVPLGTLIYSWVGGRRVRQLLLAEFSLMAAGFLIMGLATKPLGFLTGCFVNQLGAGMLLPTLLVWAMSLLPFEVRGRGAGLWTGAFSIGQFLSPIVVTSVGNLAGGVLPAFAALSAAAALGAVAAAASIFRPASDLQTRGV